MSNSTLKYIGKRLVISLITLFVILMVLFLMVKFLPGSPINNETDVNARWQLMIDAEKIMMDDLCYIPVFEKGTATLQNKDVKGLVIRPVGVPYTFQYVSK